MLVPRLKFTGENKSRVYLNSRQKSAKEAVQKKIDKKKYQFESIPCAICKKKDFKKVCDKDRYGLFVPVVVCKTCGLVQTNPRMTEKSYNEFYENEYTNLYMASDPASVDMFNWQRNHGKQVYNILKNNKISLKNKTVVEVGCGPGGLLDYFKEKGCAVQGFEPHKESVEYGKSRGLNLKTGFLKNFKGKADIIIYSHVLEHILDPVDELKLIKSKLNRKGTVYIEVPSIENVDDFFESDLGRYFQNAHVYHYTQRSLKNLATVSGFDITFSDKFTHSVWKIKSITNKIPKIKSDYKNVLELIEYLENRHKNIFDIAIMKKRVFRNGLYFLRATKLDKPLKKIYFKVKKGGSYSVTP